MTQDLEQKITEKNFAKILYFPGIKAEPIITEAEVETTAKIMAEYLAEKRARPDLTTILEKFPRLLAEYLTLKESDKSELDVFRKHHSSYMIGEGEGTDIQYLAAPLYSFGFPICKGTERIERLARKCRMSYQLEMFFDFYLQQETEAKEAKLEFNNNYIAKNPQLRRKYGRKGYNFIQTVKKNWLEVSEIVDIVAQVQPEIKRYYKEPHSEKSYNIVHLPL